MSCGAAEGGVTLDGVDLGSQSVIQGTVARGGDPVRTGYARLLDDTGEFTAEVPLSPSGGFRFFAAPGRWTVRVLAPGASLDRAVAASRGEVAELVIDLGG